MRDTAFQEPDRPVLLKIGTRDPDEYMEIVSRYHSPVRIETATDPSFSFESDVVITGGICVSQTTCTTGVKIRFESLFDGYGLTLPSSGSFTAQVARQGLVQARTGAGIMLDSASVMGAEIGPDTQMPRIAVTTAEMHGRLAELMDQPVVRPIRFAQHVPQDSASTRMASSLARLVQEGMRGDAPLLHYPAALASLRDALLHLLLEAFPHSYSDEMSRHAPLPAPGHVRRAIDFMVAHASRPLRLHDIAVAAGSSVRSLQIGFIQFRGMPPMAYLRRIRLNGARAQLQMGLPGTTVAHVAYSWGFAQHSSFSTLYVRAFGESPLATLRRAAGP